MPLRPLDKFKGQNVASVSRRVRTGQTTLQSLETLLDHNLQDLSRFTSFMVSKNGILKTSSEMEHVKKFLASVAQKHHSQQNLVKQANRGISQIDRALSRLRQQAQKFWTKHGDVKQMLQKKVYDPVQMQQRQLRTFLKTDPATQMKVFVMPDNTLVMTPADYNMTFQCDGRAYEHYMNCRPNQPEPRTFYHFSGTQQIYVDTDDYDNHMKMNAAGGSDFPMIIFLSPDPERIPSTISFDAVSQWNFVGQPHCNQGTSINVHKIDKIILVPPPFVP